MKAWLVTARTWPGLEMIYLAPTRETARSRAMWEEHDAGYLSSYLDFSAVRAPEHDQESDKIQELGWHDGEDAWGCFANA